MQFQVTDIEFDLSTDDDSIPEEHIDIVQKELQDEIVGEIWEADDVDVFVEDITCATGWPIKSIDYLYILS